MSVGKATYGLTEQKGMSENLKRIANLETVDFCLEWDRVCSKIRRIHAKEIEEIIRRKEEY